MGNNKWQLRWAKLAACQQTKVWFPEIKNVSAHFVRKLNRYDLSHVIHFTTGHNNLLRHRCKLDGGEVMCADCVGGSKEDALHLWTECSATWDLGEGSLLGFLSNGQYVSSAGSSGSQQLLNCWTVIGQNILRLALVSRGNL